MTLDLRLMPGVPADRIAAARDFYTRAAAGYAAAIADDTSDRTAAREAMRSAERSLWAASGEWSGQIVDIDVATGDIEVVPECVVLLDGARARSLIFGGQVRLRLTHARLLAATS